ncbi:MAG: bifunctional demethylmenaquinone methyltransferase/2-methoxy-6-polyprenyl-1,4-benzoquinol methylase UbiE [Chitinophagales bacterium]|nr:bifunctional demethylmenaquinone methyltransferase/2-methoxy-6-polyprenyl-1,4-benzoquinol methylase UbiE [Bacteroidota bacterium]MCB9226055.1 bifunctional demethylmenaquinone methyltransferase/2-methoxy-6-polyprenyl-1,4-benzoquinol methylase UbiE [Chitinophagales bacterium]
MSNKVTPYLKEDESKKKQVEQMFDNIAHRYDFLNHLLSAGIDKLWRKKAIESIRPYKPKIMMDMATGTGDFAIDASERLDLQQLVALDLSEEMLEIGKKKIKTDKHKVINFVKGDSENINFADNTFDAMTAGFGVRNFENLEKGLSEMLRVLKPGAPLVILEISQPDNKLLKGLFGIYFKGILPAIGKLFSKDHRAYTYLPESVEAFPKGKEFTEILKKVGFKNAKHQALTLGICAMYLCEK